MKINPHDDPSRQTGKQAFVQALMDSIKTSRRARGLPEDLKDWTPEQLAERDQAWQILSKLDLFAPAPLDQQPSPPPRLDVVKGERE